jgi:hypothetical protein
MSLKENLNKYIQEHGEVEYQSLKDLVEGGYFKKKYRMETATRRLRNESPEVQAIEENGYIIKYRWTGEPLKKTVCEPDPLDKSKVICREVVITPIHILSTD